MQKIIPFLLGLLFINTSHSAPSKRIDVKNTLHSLYAPVARLKIEKIPLQWLNNLNNIIQEITQQAIQKSKNLRGQQNMTLILAATVIRDVTQKIVLMYAEMTLQDINQISYLLQGYAELKNQLIKEKKKINTIRFTKSEQDATQELIETINFLISPMLDRIEGALQIAQVW